jgi:hypothetical protein
VTVSSIGDLVDGAPVLIKSVVGMTELNGNTYIAKGISGNTFQLYDTSNAAVSTTAFTTYVSGGSVYDGGWDYPEGFIWPDAVQKFDGSLISIMDSDEYPHIKNSVIKPPTSTYPVIMFRDGRGFVDPFDVSFRMSYVKTPVDPYWAYTVANDEPVYTGSGSVDFSLDPMAHLRICMKILQAIGINLDAAQISAYAQMKENSGI